MGTTTCIDDNGGIRILPNFEASKSGKLRHSCASLLLNNGFTLKDVQEYMGHADIQMTANIYGHLDMQRKELLTQKMASSLF